MVNTNFWIKADGLGIDVFLLCSLILSLFKKKNGKKKTSRASLLHCQSQLKRHRRYFCQLYRSPGGKKETRKCCTFFISPVVKF